MRLNESQPRPVRVLMRIAFVIACAMTPGLAATGASGQPAQIVSEFHLSVPGMNAPPETTKPLLAWTRPTTIAPGNRLLGYIVEVARDEQFLTNRQVFQAGPDHAPSFSFKQELEPGVRYYWRVFAVTTTDPNQTLAQCVQSRNCNEVQSREVFNFRTAFSPFSRLESAGFTLQRTRTGDKATEGAQFGFSRNLTSEIKPDQERTTYTADFALIWDSPRFYRSGDSRVFIIPQLYVEGKLNNQNNKAEDAWRFGGAAVMVTDFSDRSNLSKCKVIDGLYMSFGAKHESTQDFETKKFVTESMVAPTSRLLGMGVAMPGTDCGRGRPEDKQPIQIMWQPFFEFHYGRTIRLGESMEVKDNVLRLVPRIRVDLFLNKVRDVLGIHQALLYVEDTYYNLPLEDGANTHNLFVTGFEFRVISNFGFGLIYKKGSSAPKFEYGNTFAGTLTVRFGKAKQL